MLAVLPLVTQITQLKYRNKTLTWMVEILHCLNYRYQSSRCQYNLTLDVGYNIVVNF